MNISDAARTALIIGAGAIGRGFLAPRLIAEGLKVVFADNDIDLVASFKSRKSRTYQTAVALEEGYDLLQVQYEACDLIDNLGPAALNASYVFFCVGVKEVERAAKILQKQLPQVNELISLYSLENDPLTTKIISVAFQDKFPVHFCVPDVITSSKAPPQLMNLDPLCLASEPGEIYLEGRELVLTGPKYTDAYVQQHWIAKKYLHNTPHAALAYLGAQKNYEFIHQAANDVEIHILLLKLVRYIRAILELEYKISDAFLTDYIHKELKRFGNANLCDPIERVARNPDVKLKYDERLIYVLRLLEKYDQPTEELIQVVRAVLEYNGCKKFTKQRELHGVAVLLSQVCRIEPESKLGQTILSEPHFADF